VVFVGRLIEQKGASDLLAAAAQLSDFPNLHIVVVGDGPDRPGLEKLARELGIADRVTFSGWLEPNRVFEQMAAADIVAGPSRTARSGSVEAQGIVFAEALLMGTNVIGTRSGGIPDTVIHERTGLLVDERAPDQIAAAIRRLLSDPRLAARLRTEGRQFALANLTRERTAAAFDSLYREVLLTRTPA
jgi:glycosyltransferase involved in cell wall biosynthesis